MGGDGGAFIGQAASGDGFGGGLMVQVANGGNQDNNAQAGQAASDAVNGDAHIGRVANEDGTWSASSCSSNEDDDGHGNDCPIVGHCTEDEPQCGYCNMVLSRCECDFESSDDQAPPFLELSSTDSSVVVMEEVKNGVIQIDGAQSTSNSSQESQEVYDTESIQSPMNTWGPDQRSSEEEEEIVLVQPANYQEPEVRRFCIEGAANCYCLTYGWYAHQRIWNWRKLTSKRY